MQPVLGQERRFVKCLVMVFADFITTRIHYFNGYSYKLRKCMSPAYRYLSVFLVEMSTCVKIHIDLHRMRVRTKRIEEELLVQHSTSKPLFLWNT